jgi:hypothetical protein
MSLHNRERTAGLLRSKYARSGFSGFAGKCSHEELSNESCNQRSARTMYCSLKIGRPIGWKPCRPSSNARKTTRAGPITNGRGQALQTNVVPVRGCHCAGPRATITSKIMMTTLQRFKLPLSDPARRLWIFICQLPRNLIAQLVGQVNSSYLPTPL